MNEQVPSKDVSTPRTDAVASDSWSGDAVCVDVDFARQLERELNEVRQANAELLRRNVVLSSAHEPPTAPADAFGQMVTDGMIVAIYAGEEGAEFKLLRHNSDGLLCEVRRPWGMRGKYRPATYDEIRSTCLHGWLSSRLCPECSPPTKIPECQHDKSKPGPTLVPLGSAAFGSSDWTWMCTVCSHRFDLPVASASSEGERDE